MDKALLNARSDEYLVKGGRDLFERLTGQAQWQELRTAMGLEPQLVQHDSDTNTSCSWLDSNGRLIDGVNFAMRDHLSLSVHPRVRNAGVDAMSRYGAHIVGPRLLACLQPPVDEFQVRLADYLGYREAALFSTNWSAACGVLRVLLRPDDIVLLDEQVSPYLWEAARTVSTNLLSFAHLSTTALERELERIRLCRPNAGILVVTETLFEYDADTPDLAAHQALVKSHGAVLLVHATNDLGCVGSRGRGLLHEQGVLGKIDLLLGDLGPVFATGGGFVLTNQPALKLALRQRAVHGNYTCGITPVQAAIALSALDIITSDEGQALRDQLHKNVSLLRWMFSDCNFPLCGVVSPSVSVPLGSLERGRLIVRHLLDSGGLVELHEPGSLSEGYMDSLTGSEDESSLLLRVMAEHSEEQIYHLIDIFNQSVANADRQIGGASVTRHRQVKRSDDVWSDEQIQSSKWYICPNCGSGVF